MRIGDSLRPALVISLFATMAGLLVRDHVLPFFDEGERVRVEARMVEDAWVVDRDDTMAIMFKGQPIGAIRTSAEKLESEGGPEYLFTLAGELDGALLKGRVGWAALANRRMELSQFTATVDAPKLSAMLSRGTGAVESQPIVVTGLVHNGSLLLRVEQGGTTHHFRQPLKGPILLSEAIESSLFGMMRRRNHLYRVDVVDPFIAASSTPAFITYEGPRQLRGGTVRLKELLSPDGTLGVHRYTVRMGRLKSIYDVNNSGRVVSREVSVLSAPTPGTGRDVPPLFPPIRLELADNHAMIARYKSLRSMPARPAATLESMREALSAGPLDTKGIAPLLRPRGNGTSSPASSAGDQPALESSPDA